MESTTSQKAKMYKNYFICLISFKFSLGKFETDQPIRDFIKFSENEILIEHERSASLLNLQNGEVKAFLHEEIKNLLIDELDKVKIHEKCVFVHGRTLSVVYPDSKMTQKFDIISKFTGEDFYINSLLPLLVKPNLIRVCGVLTCNITGEIKIMCNDIEINSKFGNGYSLPAGSAYKREGIVMPCGGNFILKSKSILIEISRSKKKEKFDRLWSCNDLRLENADKIHLFNKDNMDLCGMTGSAGSISHFRRHTQDENTKLELINSIEFREEVIFSNVISRENGSLCYVISQNELKVVDLKSMSVENTIPINLFGNENFNRKYLIKSISFGEVQFLIIQVGKSELVMLEIEF